MTAEENKLDQVEIIATVRKEISKTERLIIEYKELTEPISPDDAIGRITRMDAINNKSVVESSLRQAEIKLKNLNRVLDLAGTNNFGVCQKCGNSIGIRRIMIRPESLYCVKCAV